MFKRRLCLNMSSLMCKLFENSFHHNHTSTIFSKSSNMLSYCLKIYDKCLISNRYFHSRLYKYHYDWWMTSTLHTCVMCVIPVFNVNAFIKRRSSRSLKMSYNSLMSSCSKNFTHNEIGTRNEDMTMKQVSKRLSDILNLQPLYSSPRDVPVPQFKSQSELPMRRVSDSAQVAVIPIGRDPYLRERYITFYGTSRFGRILEDIDDFATWIALCYCIDVSKPGVRFPYVLATALVDRIIITETVLANLDIQLSGSVNWVGQSSMEICIRLYQGYTDDTENLSQKLNARFVFVCRSPDNSRKVDINKLLLETDDEKEIFKHADARMKLRRKKTEQSLLLKPPSEAERCLIHDLFLRTVDPKSLSYQVKQKLANSVWMHDTRVKSVMMCHPQERNNHSKIFGGFIMRQAFELAWTNVMLLCRSTPQIVAVHDIIFRHPVDIGDVLQISSKVVYSSGIYAQVRVRAMTAEIANVGEITTNIFYFTFRMKEAVPFIQPTTYAEAMLYLDGKRTFDLRKIRSP